MGTLNYKGPELLVGLPVGSERAFKRHTPLVCATFSIDTQLNSLQAYDYSLDMWAVGAWAAEMVFRKYHFFPGRETNNNQLDAITQVLGTEELETYLDKYGIDLEHDVGR